MSENETFKAGRENERQTAPEPSFVGSTARSVAAQTARRWGRSAGGRSARFHPLIPGSPPVTGGLVYRLCHPHRLCFQGPCGLRAVGVKLSLPWMRPAGFLRPERGCQAWRTPTACGWDPGLSVPGGARPRPWTAVPRPCLRRAAALCPSPGRPQPSLLIPSVRRAGCGAPSEQRAREASRAAGVQVEVRKGCVRMRRADGNVLDGP